MTLYEMLLIAIILFLIERSSVYRNRRKLHIQVHKRLDYIYPYRLTDCKIKEKVFQIWLLVQPSGKIEYQREKLLFSFVYYKRRTNKEEQENESINNN